LLFTGDQLGSEIARNPHIADFLVSILYAAASTKRDLTVTLNPYPSGVGYIDASGVFQGFRKEDLISQGAALICTTLDKLPRMSELCKIDPKVA
jgi:hypothetical protein